MKVYWHQARPSPQTCVCDLSLMTSHWYFSDFASCCCVDYVIYWNDGYGIETRMKSPFFDDSDSYYEGDVIRCVKNCWRLCKLVVNFDGGKSVSLIKPELPYDFLRDQIFSILATAHQLIPWTPPDWLLRYLLRVTPTTSAASYRKIKRLIDTYFSS
jgi:hypothetical protein